MLKKIILVLTTIFILAATGCGKNISQAQMSIPPKTSGYYTSTSSGSNGPSFQFIILTNPVDSSGILYINSLAFSQPNPSPSITIANRITAMGESDPLYGNLPECSTSQGIGQVNALSYGQTCGILVQGLTYDPSHAAQISHLSLKTTIANQTTEHSFVLTNVTHVYVSAGSTSIGSVTPVSQGYMLADCSNSSNNSGQALSCINALGDNSQDNFISISGAGAAAISAIQVFPNGNLILGGQFIQAGHSESAGSSGSQSIVVICRPDTDECQNALAPKTFFAKGQGGLVSQITLNPNTNNATFFATGAFNDIVGPSGTVTGYSGTLPRNAAAYFVANCTIGGGCSNIMPGDYISTNRGDSSSNVIQALSYNPISNEIYFAGGFTDFTGLTNPNTFGFPIIACSLATGSMSSCTNYFSPDTSNTLNASGGIFGLNSVTTSNGHEELEVNTGANSIGGLPYSHHAISAICTQSGCSNKIESSVGSYYTMQSVYDPHTGLFYIGGLLSGLGGASSGSLDKLLLADCNNSGNCFDVLGGGNNGRFQGYPDLYVRPIVGNVGSQLTISEQS